MQKLILTYIIVKTIKRLYEKNASDACAVAEDILTGGTGLLDDIPSLAGALTSASYILAH